jgi:hypothetical protein
MISFRHCICRHVAVFAAALICLYCAAHGQTVSRPAAQNDDRNATDARDDEFVLRTYDVNDLVLNVPDYPYPEGRGLSSGQTGGGGFGGGGFGGGGGGGGSGFFSVADGVQPAPKPAEITMDVLIDAITNTVNRESWADNGGEAEVRPVGNALVVWQTRSAHEQIGDLLNVLEVMVDERKTITIDARWLLLNSDDLDRLTAGDAGGLATLDRKQLASLTRRPTTIRGLTNCFSGQLVYVVSGTRRNFVSGYIPVVGSVEAPRGDAQFAAVRHGARVRFVADQAPLGGGKEKGVGYQPIVERSTRGALLEIRPTVMRDSKSAIVDLRSTLTIPGGQSLRVSDQSESAPAPPVVDRIAMDTQEFATTLRVPLGAPVLVGGLTYVPPAIGTVRDDGSGQLREVATENPQYYLVLELR